MKTAVFMSSCRFVLRPSSTKDKTTHRQSRRRSSSPRPWSTKDKATVFGLTKDETTKDSSATDVATKDEKTKDIP